MLHDRLEWTRERVRPEWTRERVRPEWTRERVQAAMHGGETIEVPLPQPIPVRIEYQTAAVGEDGLVYFFDDIYGLDEALEEQLITAGLGPRPRG
ncbi:MAG TPA: hypothetical protein VIY49_04365 [Bryobacteraceae bacterium]